eukprot:COSAG05_NODE_1600_length_4447_cov_80.937088_3_plen_341_part_00
MHCCSTLGLNLGVETVVQVDSSGDLLHRDTGLPSFSPPPGVELHRLTHDEEFLLLPPGAPAEAGEVFNEATQGLLQPGSFDCVISNLALHWMNDLPGVLAQARHLLKPDGLFLAVMLGGDTLYELRAAMAIAEQERDGGLSPRVSPQVGVDDAGSLLTRAGFTLLTVDTDQLVVPFPDALTLMHELSCMGEANAVHMRRGWLPRDTLVAAAALYEELHGDPSTGDDANSTADETGGVVPATFELIYMIGWAPSQKQPRPLERGSATQSLAEGLAAATGTGATPNEGVATVPETAPATVDPAGAPPSPTSSTSPTPFSLADIARQTGGWVGRVSTSDDGDS